MVPSVAKSIGFNTLHLNRNAGMKQIGIQTQEHIPMEQFSFNKQYSDIFYISNFLDGIDGRIQDFSSFMILMFASLQNTLPYFFESNGCNFYMPQKLILYEAWQTILDFNETLYNVFQPKQLEKKLQIHSLITGQMIIHSIEAGIQQYCCCVKHNMNPAIPPKKQIPSIIAYIS